MVAFAQSTPLAPTLGGFYLGVLAGRETCLIPIGQVRDVSFVGPITPVPGWPAYYPGYVNREGTLSALIDLPAFLGMSDTLLPHPCHAAVFVRLPERSPLQLGLIVAHLPRLIEVPAHAVTLTPKDESDSRPHPTVGTARIDSINATILDVGRLFPTPPRPAPILTPAPVRPEFARAHHWESRHFSGQKGSSAP